MSPLIVLRASAGGTSLPLPAYAEDEVAGMEALERMDCRDEPLDEAVEADEDSVERRLSMDPRQGDGENEAVEEREAEDSEEVEDDE